MRSLKLSCAGVLSLAACSASAQVSWYGIQFQYNYEQTEPAAVVLSNHIFYAQVFAPSAQLLGSSVTSPGSAGTNAMTEVVDGDFAFGEIVDDGADFAAAYPAGTYSFQVPSVAGGPTSATVGMPSPIAYPSEIPNFSPATWTAMQSFDATRDFTLTFNTFTTGAPLAMTQLEIVEKATGKRAFYRELAQGTTSSLVPGGTLTPNIEYTAVLYFTSAFVTENAGFVGARSSALVIESVVAPMIVLNPCPTDFNNDGFSNGDDYDAFVIEFEAGNAPADFDGNGFVNGDDFDAFVVAFEAGC